MSDFKPFLSEIFQNSDQLMWQLSEDLGYFTDCCFIRKATTDRANAYDGLLNSIASQPHEDAPLFIAQRYIGNFLRDTAEKVGYVVDEYADVRDVNFCGDAVDCVVFRRTEQVKRPAAQSTK